MRDEAVDGFDLEDHACGEAEGVVVYFTVFVESPVAKVMDIYLAKAFVFCACDDGVVEGGFQ
jgi:hypothetical protein